MPYADPEKRRECQRRYQARRRAQHPEEMREYKRQWRFRHPEKERVYYARYYSEHREQKRESLARWRTEHSAEIRAYSARYWVEHREEKQEYDRRRRIAHPETYREANHRYRALKVGATIERVHAVEVYERDRYRCHVCGRLVPARERSLDHLVPLSRGGAHSLSNVALAHKRCNFKRYNSGLAQLRLW